ncbi:TIGR03620 family F420-dependent LLM class oxidoreductase [Microbacterium immunditiarum]|uniref:Putative F420-dependent oxidoreductase n=1 Tax=Microbacterium immunditiarum TaxID=337480 RepID=A0A7Y9GLR9_9MICO|nr:TIGR03620 family F420-dependent LLM class oxidoreductase [Microbacterium immunditiarum]NYE18777.1 putative F420-dependent oxidoreductase [Microbacterium immunditiarum]
MTEPQRPLGTFGVWRRRDGATPDFAAGVERLGYTTLWIGGSPGADLAEAEACLDATEDLVVATGIVNIWRGEAREAAAAFHRLEARHPGRFVLGIGSGHPEADARRAKPLAAMREYLDVLDAEGVPAGRRVVAALGPKTLRLAAERSLGAHPYLTPPGHTRWARGVVGPDALLAPEQMVVAETDAATARAVGRSALRRYLRLQNYASMLRASGFGDDELAGDGNDRVVDELTAWGDPAALASALRAHLDAGADHVCVQVLPIDGDALPALAELRAALA